MSTPLLLTYNRWRDVEYVPIHDQCQINQSAVEDDVLNHTPGR
jgi:hypothetical protein